MEDDLTMVGARVTPDLKRKMRIEAAKRDMTMNDFIIALVEQYFALQNPAQINEGKGELNDTL